MLTTYVGFAFGAVNTLFLYTSFLGEEYFGLVMFILAGALILQPLLSFGIQDTIVKFYSTHKTGQEQQGFLGWMLLMPLLVIIPSAFLFHIFRDEIGDWLSIKNDLIKPYSYLIYLIGFAMAYFEVFYAWCKVHLKSVFGNVMKEIFARVCVCVLLLLVYFELISKDQFLLSLGLIYLLRTVVIMWYAFYLKIPSFSLKLPPNINEIIRYASFIVLAGSVVIVLLEIDKQMIGILKEGLGNVAYYGVATFVAMVIVVPNRAMSQITHPLTAELINNNDTSRLLSLYRKTSLNLFTVGGLIFLLIILNIDQLYEFIDPAYKQGIIVVILIGVAKLMDNVMGNSTSILYNSKYYRTVLFLGVALAIFTILFNWVLIPKMGINGAAVATLLSLTIYNSIKVLVIWRSFKMHPFQNSQLIILAMLLAFSGLFYFWNFDFHPILNITLKSIIVSLIYLGLIYKLEVSSDINSVLNKYIKKAPSSD